MVLRVLKLQEPLPLNSQTIPVFIPKHCPKIKFVVLFFKLEFYRVLTWFVKLDRPQPHPGIGRASWSLLKELYIGQSSSGQLGDQAMPSMSTLECPLLYKTVLPELLETPLQRG